MKYPNRITPQFSALGLPGYSQSMVSSTGAAALLSAQLGSSAWHWRSRLAKERRSGCQSPLFIADKYQGRYYYAVADLAKYIHATQPQSLRLGQVELEPLSEHVADQKFDISSRIDFADFGRPYVVLSVFPVKGDDGICVTPAEARKLGEHLLRAADMCVADYPATIVGAIEGANQTTPPVPDGGEADVELDRILQTV